MISTLALKTLAHVIHNHGIDLSKLSTIQLKFSENLVMSMLFKQAWTNTL